MLIRAASKSACAAAVSRISGRGEYSLPSLLSTPCANRKICVSPLHNRNALSVCEPQSPSSQWWYSYRYFSSNSSTNPGPLKSTEKASAKPSSNGKKDSKEHAGLDANSFASFAAFRQHQIQEFYKTCPSAAPPLSTADSPFFYANDFVPTISLGEFHAKYDANTPPAARMKDKVEQVAGRIVNKRVAGSKLVFYDIVGDSSTSSSSSSSSSFQSKLQVLSTISNFASRESEFRGMNRVLEAGDIIGVVGFVGKTDRGELSIVATDVRLLSPCFHELPFRVLDHNVRYRQRYLDMMVNESTQKTLMIRAKVMKSLRKFLDDRGFVEVETPILWPAPGGATAKPFVTHSSALGSKIPLYMRIAPELFLKELVIGGMPRVYELGRVFRNEGIDATHHPEFTSLEFYETYSNYRKLMKTTEEMLRSVVQSTTGSLIVTTKKFDNPDEQIEIDFSKDFAVIDIVDELQRKLGDKLPDPNSEASLPQYVALLDKHKLHLSPPMTVSRALDKLIGHFLEPLCTQPTFLIHHPLSLSPLARSHHTLPGLTERFELFINGREFANAYSELNDAHEQRRRLQLQKQAQAAGDEEANVVDEQFCTALEWGLPPTGGFGLGVDRLIMLLSANQHVRDVLYFPVTRPEEFKS